MSERSEIWQRGWKAGYEGLRIPDAPSNEYLEGYNCGQMDKQIEEKGYHGSSNA